MPRSTPIRNIRENIDSKESSSLVNDILSEIDGNETRSNAL